MTNKPFGVGVIGVGKYTPSTVITNAQVESWTQIPAQIIVDKTGIITRYIADDDETASGMSAAAARQAISMAQIHPDEIGLIVGCTFSGDYIYPPMACKVQG